MKPINKVPQVHTYFYVLRRYYMPTVWSSLSQSERLRFLRHD